MQVTATAVIMLEDTPGKTSLISATTHALLTTSRKIQQIAQGATYNAEDVWESSTTALSAKEVEPIALFFLTTHAISPVPHRPMATKTPISVLVVTATVRSAMDRQRMSALSAKTVSFKAAQPVIPHVLLSTELLVILGTVSHVTILA